MMLLDLSASSTTLEMTMGGIPNTMDATPIASFRFSTFWDSREEIQMSLGNPNLIVLIWDEFGVELDRVLMGIEGEGVWTELGDGLMQRNRARYEIKAKYWRRRR